MRKHILHIVHVLVLVHVLVSPSIAAELTHQPGFWVAGGEHTLLTDKEHALGGTASLGFEYRLQAGYFLMQTGVGMAYNAASFHPADYNAELPGAVDLDGYEFTFVYQFSDRKDTYSSLELQVPLMFGASFPTGSGEFYFLLGGKFSFRPIGWVNMQVMVSTYGDYPQFLDPFTGMPEHQFFDARPLNSLNPLNPLNSLNPLNPLNSLTPLASAELGYTMALPRTARGRGRLLRIALYADVGVLNTFPFYQGMHLSDGLMFLPDTFNNENMFTPLGINPYLSACSKETVLRDLSVGLKLSYAWSIPARHYRKSAPCHCVQ